MLLQFNGCDDCSLKKQWPWLSHPRMPMTLPSVIRPERVMAIGEGPGETEDIQGIQFIGPAGQTIRNNLPEDWKQSLYWQNAVRCRPPENRTPTLNEVACCSGYLEEDIRTADPHVILCVGGVALDYFWAEEGITAARGVPFPIQMDDGRWRWGYSIFHPSYVNRGTRKRINQNGKEESINYILPVFRTDIIKLFQRLPEFLTPPTPPPVPDIKNVCFPKTVEEVKNLFSRLKEPFGFDIETSKLKPYHRDAKILTAAFSDGETHFAFPVWWPSMIYWGDEALAWCMAQNKHFIAHNAPFELVWIWWNYPGCSMLVEHDDTQGLARIHYQRKALLSLDDQTRIHVGRGIKSITGVDSKQISSYPLEQVLYYNALDAWGSWVVRKGITLTPSEEINYARLLKVNKSIATMELLGLPVDLGESEKLDKELAEKQQTLQEEALTIPECQRYTRERKQFSISAPADVGAVLVSYCGLHLPKTAKGQYSTDESNLTELIGKHRLVDLTLDYREIAKLRSTYVKPIWDGRQLGIDGHIHASYSPTLTFTMRLSSQDPNIQNWPKRKHREIRRQVVAPPGFVIVAFDYGQIEARVIGMAAKDAMLIRTFIDDIDMHTKWLTRLVKKFPAYLDLKAKASGETEEKMIWKAARTAIKTDWTFSIIYGAIPSTIAHNAQIPLRIAEELSGEFWKEHASLRAWIDKQTQFYLDNGYVALLTDMIRNEVLPGNEVVNTPVQGTATGHIVQEAQVAMWDLAVETREMDFVPRIQVHDDLTYFMRDDSDLERKIKLTAQELVKPRFSFSYCPLTVEGQVGPNWCDVEKVGEWKGDYLPLPTV